jgi:hypothetical protein
VAFTAASREKHVYIWLQKAPQVTTSTLHSVALHLKYSISLAASACGLLHKICSKTLYLDTLNTNLNSLIMSGRPEHQAPPEIVSLLSLSFYQLYKLSEGILSFSFTMKKKLENTPESKC